jgi:adenosylmethionine-8-amino-7-oxononanoate aminotransferase
MEASMKLTRQYFLELSPPQPARTKFIARYHSYHGATLGALSMGGHLARRKPFQPLLLDNVTHIPPCNPYRDMIEGESIDDYVHRLAKQLDDEFHRLGPSNVCAFVAEPVVGAVSFVCFLYTQLSLMCEPAYDGCASREPFRPMSWDKDDQERLPLAG